MPTLLQDIVALLAISNPLGALPVFLAITESVTPAERLRAALRAALAATIILAVAALAGRPILAAFGISMPALQAAGGLVILLMGLEMLHGAPTKVQHDEAPQSATHRNHAVLSSRVVDGGDCRHSPCTVSCIRSCRCGAVGPVATTATR